MSRDRPASPVRPSARLRRPRPAPRRPAEDEREASVLAAVLGVLALFFIVALSGWLLTSHDTGVRYLRHALARITEIDLLVMEGRERMLEAALASPDDAVRLPGYPIGVDLRPEFVAQAPPAAIRDAVLEASSERIYDEGPDAFLEEGATPGSFGALSAGGAIRRSLSFAGEGAHTTFGFATLALGAACLLTAALIWRRARDVERTLVMLGVSLGGAAATVVLGALLTRGIAELLQAVLDEYLVDQLLDIVTEATTLVVRTSGVIALAGAVLALGGWALRRFATPSPA